MEEEKPNQITIEIGIILEIIFLASFLFLLSGFLFATDYFAISEGINTLYPKWFPIAVNILTFGWVISIFLKGLLKLSNIPVSLNGTKILINTMKTRIFS